MRFLLYLCSNFIQIQRVKCKYELQYPGVCKFSLFLSWPFCTCLFSTEPRIEPSAPCKEHVRWVNQLSVPESVQLTITCFFHLIYGSGNATADKLRSLKSGDSRSKSAVQFQNMMCSTPPNVTREVIRYENFVVIIPV